MLEPKAFSSREVWIVALQWTGDNLSAIQAFVTPSSPYYIPPVPAAGGGTKAAELRVLTSNEDANAKWPSIGPHFNLTAVPIGSWLIKRPTDIEGVVHVLSAQTFAERFAERTAVSAVRADTERAVAAFSLGGPLKATHPRCATDAGEIEPAADEDGSTIDKVGGAD